MHSMTLIFLGIAAAVIAAILFIRRSSVRRDENAAADANLHQDVPATSGGAAPASSDAGLADTELVAVIAAAIAAATGQSVDQFVVRRIIRPVEYEPLWAMMGRQETINARRV